MNEKRSESDPHSPVGRVLSPVTALAHDFEINCRSDSLTPKRRLSMSSAIGNDSYEEDGQFSSVSEIIEFNKDTNSENVIPVADKEIASIDSSRKKGCSENTNGPPKITDFIKKEKNRCGHNALDDNTQFPKPLPHIRRTGKENSFTEPGIARLKSAPSKLKNEDYDDDTFFDKYEYLLTDCDPGKGLISRMDTLMNGRILSHSADVEPGTFSNEIQKCKDSCDSKSLSTSWNGVKPLSQTFERTKRSEPPRGSSPVAIKRSKSQVLSPFKKTSSGTLARSISLHTFTAPTVIDNESDLVADGSRRFALPRCMGPKCDLRNISPSTLAELMQGNYCDVLDEFVIVDCRYPYEFKGGHIKGAVSIHTTDGIESKFLSKTETYKNKKVAIIFHCEFSSKRGPHLCHYLRKRDRTIHADSYPNLYYPELYLLCGGYTAFFKEFKELCEPQNHVKMCDKNYTEELKHFMRKSKTWSGETSKRRRLYTNYEE